MGQASLRKFPRDVRRRILDLEAAGCRVRVKDGSHVILYPPKGGGPTLKVSASRSARTTMYYIEKQFMEPNGVEL
jgi:hypothetical protein